MIISCLHLSGRGILSEQIFHVESLTINLKWEEYIFTFVIKVKSCLGWQRVIFISQDKFDRSCPWGFLICFLCKYVCNNFCAYIKSCFGPFYRDYDGKVTAEEVASAAMYLKDTLGKEGIQELVSNLSKDRGLSFLYWLLFFFISFGVFCVSEQVGLRNSSVLKWRDYNVFSYYLSNFLFIYYENQFMNTVITDIVFRGYRWENTCWGHC